LLHTEKNSLMVKWPSLMPKKKKIKKIKFGRIDSWLWITALRWLILNFLQCRSTIIDSNPPSRVWRHLWTIPDTCYETSTFVRRKPKGGVCVRVRVSACMRERVLAGNCKRQGCHVRDYLRWSMWRTLSLTITQKHTPLAFLRFTITLFLPAL